MGKVRNIKGVVFTKRANWVFNSQVKYNISGVNANPPSRDLRHKVTNSREKTRKFALFCLVLLGFVKRKHYTIVLQILPSLQVSLSSDSQPLNWEMQRAFLFFFFSITFSNIHVYADIIYKEVLAIIKSVFLCTQIKSFCWFLFNESLASSRTCFMLYGWKITIMLLTGDS